MSNMKLSLYADNNCSTGPCPKVYKTEDGRYFVQGYIVDNQITDGIDLPSGEQLVEVDQALIDNIITKSR